MNDEDIQDESQTLTRREMTDAADESGLMVVREVTIAKLRDMGLAAQTAGLTEVAKGAIIMALARGMELLDGISEVAKKAKTAKLRIECAFAGAAVIKGIQGCADTVNKAGLAAPPISNKKPKTLSIVSKPIEIQKTG